MNQTRTDLLCFLEAGRRRWRLRTVVRGVAWGVAAGAAVALGLLALDAAGWIPAAARGALRWLPLAVALVVPLAALVMAVQHAPGDVAMALRAEEVAPELEHLPTTLLELPPDHPYAPMLAARTAERLGLRARAGPLVGPPLDRRQGAGTAVIVAASVAALLLAGGPGRVWHAWGMPSPVDPAAGKPHAGPSHDATAPAPLAGLRVRIVPPSYTGLHPSEEPLGDIVSALAGSRVELIGPRSPADVSVMVEVVRAEGERHPVDVQAGADRVPRGATDGPTGAVEGWTAGWHLAGGDRGVVVSAEGVGGRTERVVPVDPRADAPPEVELLEPVEDMVLARGAGEVAFRARARDPFGVSDFRLTWVHTRGSGESFDFREGEAEWSHAVRTSDGIEGTLVLRLDDLSLGPGEVLHLRALATDENTVTGPSTGVSATRQIRVIREGDEASVDALVGLPLELEREPVLSQRMILLMTEELLGRSSALTPAEIRRESERIAGEQARLRERIAGQIYSRATGAMEAIDRHLGEGAHADEAPRAPPEPPRSRYGVASIFDPQVEPVPAAAPGTTATGSVSVPTPAPDTRSDPDPAGTQVGASRVGGAGDPPTGFGVLDELGHAHDADPVLSVSAPLLAIHDAMWEAERALRIIDAPGSVPHQEQALEGLQALRENDRVFPRGQVDVPPVDVAAVRGTGEVDDADPAPRSGGAERPSAARWAAEVERVIADLAGASGRGSELRALGDRINALAVALLGESDLSARVTGAVARAGGAAGADDAEAARTALLEAYRLLEPGPSHRALDDTQARHPPPTSVLAARAAAEAGDGAPSPDASGARGAPAAAAPAPFVFATVRYESGNWDSAPLVPQNLIHSLALYTDLPVEPEGVIVDLSSEDIFRHPVLYLTGHLPVRFSAQEADNLRTYVERGGFVFMDDHNHDLDGAFHRTATAELARIFGEDALQPIPSDHELYHAFFRFDDGPPVSAHELSGWGDGLIHRELQAVTVDGRIGVLYSNKDYSSEWSYHAVNKRFLAVDNTRFGVNILLYALTR